METYSSSTKNGIGVANQYEYDVLLKDIHFQIQTNLTTMQTLHNTQLLTRDGDLRLLQMQLWAYSSSLDKYSCGVILTPHLHTK